MHAIDLIQNNDMVLGPANDGGYWLIALSKKLVQPVADWPFSGIPWGSNKVLSKTLERAKGRNISFQLLTKQSDLDYLKDLSPWLN